MLLGLIVVATVSLSVGISLATYRYLELPGIAFGRYIAQRVRAVATMEAN